MAPALGRRDVTLTNVDSQTVTLVNGFLLQGLTPTLTGVSPATAAHTGGTTLTLTGTNFAAGSTVTVHTAPATNVTVVSPNIAPMIGPITVRVFSPDTQIATRASAFVAQGPPPAPAAVTPAGGPLAGGTTVTITGTGFLSGATVSVGGVAATMGPVTATTRRADPPPAA